MMFQPLKAKVESPNYKFDLQVLNDFFPDASLGTINNKFGQGDFMGEDSGAKTIKFLVKDTKYQFPVIVQFKDDKVEDFFARLPSYFLHDVFFQSLVNQLGKQTSFKKTNEEAFYVWEKENLKHVYSAACTITCFPIFYAVQKNRPGIKPILEKMKLN